MSAPSERSIWKSAVMRWEFCPGRYTTPASGYVTAQGQARGTCPVCGYDCALISRGRVRHHFRERANA